MVAFGAKQRFKGCIAGNNITTNPTSTINMLKRLVGRQYADPQVQADLDSALYKSKAGPDGGVLVQVDYLGELKEFTPEQVTTLSLSVSFRGFGCVACQHHKHAVHVRQTLCWTLSSIQERAYRMFWGGAHDAAHRCNTRERAKKRRRWRKTEQSFLCEERVKLLTVRAGADGACQLMGMLLGELKTIAETDQGAKITDCVIGVPVYSTDAERRAMLDAAAIAGLNPLRLMHECTATALAYGASLNPARRMMQ